MNQTWGNIRKQRLHHQNHHEHFVRNKMIRDKSEINWMEDTSITPTIKSKLFQFHHNHNHDDVDDDDDAMDEL